MPKYYPIQELTHYKYVESTSKTAIKSELQVDLSANETIQIQEPLLINPNTYYLELYVKAGGSHTSDYTWTGEKYVEISADTMYDPTVTTRLADKITAVRTRIIDLLNSYGSNVYVVIAAVTRDNVLKSNITTNDISSGADIQVI